jgi:hypothetical protein
MFNVPADRKSQREGFRLEEQVSTSSKHVAKRIRRETENSVLSVTFEVRLDVVPKYCPI